MKAVVIRKPGPPEVLTVAELPVPRPSAGWVLIQVKAFGLNRSELFTRQEVRRVFPSGVDKVLDFVGTTTLLDSPPVRRTIRFGVHDRHSRQLL